MLKIYIRITLKDPWILASLDVKIKDASHRSGLPIKTQTVKRVFLITTMCSVNVVLAIVLTLFCFIRSTNSKVYKRCELALELRNVHGIPESQLATWMCILWYESNYNTSALSPGSESYGLFQISREYWCSKVGSGCGVPCSALKDDNIRDDVNCAKHIFEQTQKITGDGFKAWTLYQYRCKANVGRYIRDCFGGGTLPAVTYFTTPSPKFATFNAPVRPVETYSKTLYTKSNKDVVYKSAKSYSFNWYRNGFRLFQSGHYTNSPARFF